MIVISEVNSRPVDRAMIADNLCFTRAGSGIRVPARTFAADDNLLVATGPCTQSIAVSATSVSDVSSISVRDPPSRSTPSSSPARPAAAATNRSRHRTRPGRSRRPKDNQVPATSATSTNASTPSPADDCSSKKPTTGPAPSGHRGDKR
jgi:hypothetical protein